MSREGFRSRAVNRRHLMQRPTFPGISKKVRFNQTLEGVRKKAILIAMSNTSGREMPIRFESQLFALDNFDQGHGTITYCPRPTTLDVTKLIFAAAYDLSTITFDLLAYSHIDEEPEDSTVTALFITLWVGNAKMAGALLDRGARTQINGRNALHAAARSGLHGMIERLVKECKVDPNVVDTDGAPPIVYALELPTDQATSAISLLKDLGASGELDLEYGLTFGDLCRAVGKESLAGIFDI
jgi:hypothetical protein